MTLCLQQICEPNMNTSPLIETPVEENILEVAQENTDLDQSNSVASTCNNADEAESFEPSMDMEALNEIPAEENMLETTQENTDSDQPDSMASACSSVDEAEDSEPSLDMEAINEIPVEENMLETTQENTDLDQSDSMTSACNSGDEAENFEPSIDTETLDEMPVEENMLEITQENTDLNQSDSLASTSSNVNETEETAVNKKVIDQVGHLTRTLHDSLRELGYDKRLESITAEVPEAQDKLSYVASKTEQAAERTLNATELAMPIQEKLSTDATELSEQWKEALESQQSQPDTEKFKALLIETLTYLNNVPSQTDATNAQLMEIMMAQDFQDLTGQVIKKVTHMVQTLEQELVQLLLANVPPTNLERTEDGLMNGPVVNPEKRSDVVSGQDQVDDLLASLGF